MTDSVQPMQWLTADLVKRNGLYWQQINGTFSQLIPRCKVRKQVFCFYAFGIVLGIVVGVCISAAIADISRPVSAFVAYTQEELAKPILLDVTRPIEIKLKIVPKEEITRIRPGAYAFARRLTRSCEIYLPAGEEIVVYPSGFRAHWRKREADDTLAHEILHCLRGKWHS